MDQSTRKERIAEDGKRWMERVPKDGNYRDISYEGCWSLSSCKGETSDINQMLNPQIESFWQSDGPQPHIITVEFPKKTDISFIMLYMNFKIDESYTPNKVVVYLGSSILELNNGQVETYHEPDGWVCIDVRNRRGKRPKPARAFVVQVQILANHVNGRDTHVRGIKVIGPIQQPTADYGYSLLAARGPYDLDAQHWAMSSKVTGLIPQLGEFRIR